ncbi:hypothetical protein ES702_07682 [subsurface metagenome]
MGLFKGLTWDTGLGFLGDVFGKKTQPPASVPYVPPSTAPVAKKDNTMLFMIGGGALLMMMMFMFMKK